MPRTEPAPDRTRLLGLSAPLSTRRVAARRRRLMRLRRTAVLALVLLLVGTVIARWLADPRDAARASAQRAAAETTTTRKGTAVDSTRPPPAGSATPPTAPSGSIATPDTPTAPTPPTAHLLAARAPTTSVAPHADEDSDGSATQAPNADKIPVPTAGAGTISAKVIPAGDVEGSGRTVRYSIEVEDGLPVSSTEFTAAVHTVLIDPRGWQSKDGVRFVPMAPAELAAGARVDVRVTLASPTLTAKLCAPLNVTAQQVSCWNGSRAVLNLSRWMLGSRTYGTDLARYRIYLISHEVGHGLGHGHVQCPGPGRPAPVMVQQTKSLEGCVASPWPTGS